MSKIESLTPAQEALKPEYVKKWVEVAISTQNINDSDAERIASEFRGIINMKTDVPSVWGKNPVECWVMCCLSEQGVAPENLESEMIRVFATQSDYPVPNKPKGLKKSNYEIPQVSLPYNTNLLSYVFSFYDYMFNVVNVKIDDELYSKYMKWQETSNIWGIYPLDGVTILCRKPTEIHLNADRLLHCDGGPAMKFDGLGDVQVFALNGIKVPKYLAETPADQIDIKMYTKEKNADVKAEFVRKVGVERLLGFGKMLDTYKNYDQEENPWWWKSEYELWDLKALFPEVEKVRFLKMKNQTTGVWHVEGISPNHDDLESAMEDRIGANAYIVSIS